MGKGGIVLGGPGLAFGMALGVGDGLLLQAVSASCTFAVSGGVKPAPDRR